MTEEEIINAIKKKAKEKDLTFLDIAKKLKRPPSTIYNLLRERQNDPLIATVIEVCNAVGLRLWCGGECTVDGIIAMLEEERRYQHVITKVIERKTGFNYSTIRGLLVRSKGAFWKYIKIADVLELDFTVEEE